LTTKSPPSKTTTVSRATLRSLREQILASQGLQRPLVAGPHAVARAVEQLGYVQIDTISVIARAHHHTLFNRVAGYQPAQLEAALTQRTLFEYWAHAAAYLPMRDYRFALVRMLEQRDKKRGPEHAKDRRMMRTVLKRIETEGPLRSRDFESKSAKTTGWWDWKPTKRALEALFMQGDLMVSGRDGFQKRYDLRERVLPDGIDTRHPNTLDYANYLIDGQLRSHAVISAQSVTHLRKGRDLRAAVREQLEHRVASHQLECVEHAGARWFISPAATNSTARSEAPGRSAYILSPFDNLVIQRDRLRQLFNFDYTLECYVPAAKRQHGYFTLPVLCRGRFVARMDAKVHRKTQLFEIKQLHWESPERGQRVSDGVIRALIRALIKFADFNDCHQIQLSDDNAVRAHPANGRLQDLLAGWPHKWPS